MVKLCSTFDRFQRQQKNIHYFPDLATVFAGKKFPAHVGPEMKQKRHYANIITMGCQFITHRDNS